MLVKGRLKGLMKGRLPYRLGVHMAEVLFVTVHHSGTEGVEVRVALRVGIAHKAWILFPLILPQAGEE